MFKHSIWIFCLSTLAIVAVADESLWKKLEQDGNMIVLMRNAESDGNRSGAGMLVWDASGACKGESTLTAEGKAQARRIGSVFRDRGINQTVISSPMCRCRETAQIAFGKYLSDPELRQRPASDARGQEAFQSRVSELLKQHRGTTPVVFVNHRPNIDSLTMELIDIGELLIGSISDDGQIEVIGNIRVIP